MLEIALQKMIYQALTGSVALMAKLAGRGVYDGREQQKDSGDPAGFPYVVIGDDTVAPLDTKTSTGGDCTITIHAWSRAGSSREVKEIQSLIYDVLHRQRPPAAGFTVQPITFLNSTSFLDQDGETQHGVSKFRAQLEKD